MSIVDPAVSRAKFDRELAQFRQREEDYQRRGCWVLSAAFPEVFAVFATPHMRPAHVVFGAKIDFENYDMWAPSVQLADPFTRISYRASEVPYHMPRILTKPSQQTGAPLVQEVLPLVQFWDPADIPFICLPGIREYHLNPGHTGDSWLLHRRGGEGTLFFVLDQLCKYGVEPIRAPNMQLAFRGYQAEIPQ